ncbi:MAG: homoserine O-succinyltransferase [Succinatimonas sp.]|nr:homoserine O-succinyltransferase [Succinatimonas sp.]
MPINIPNGLPAATVLSNEEVFVMTEDRAIHQDIRPLELLFLNLMPKKINTEIQFMRRLSNSPLQVNITLLRVDDHESRNTPQQHLNTFYKDFDDIKDKRFDGMIITGAPLDQKHFSDVTYWDRLETIINWSAKNVTSTLFSCWGVAAALKVFYGLDILFREDKLSGIYSVTRAQCNDTLIRGFDDNFLAPFSRFCDFPTRVIKQATDLKILAASDTTGLYLGVSPDRRQVYVTGHPEYDATTLADEYRRDLQANKDPHIPLNYFPNDDPSEDPSCKWRSHSSLLFANWLNYYVYQLTPYDLYE